VGANQRIKGTVKVRLKDGVLDPQGQTIWRALTQMGYDWVQEVRTGRTFEIEMEAGDEATAQRRLREISEKLLANPVIETFQVEVRP
jgi:phosphoribosylformylglycinamidine synthase